jgi:hypothetical protein
VSLLGRGVRYESAFNETKIKYIEKISRHVPSEFYDEHKQCEILGSHGGESEERDFWDIVPCSLRIDRRFRRAYYFHIITLMAHS